MEKSSINGRHTIIHTHTHIHTGSAKNLSSLSGYTPNSDLLYCHQRKCILTVITSSIYHSIHDFGGNWKAFDVREPLEKVIHSWNIENAGQIIKMDSEQISINFYCLNSLLNDVRGME